MLVDCEYLFHINLLALKFGTYVINIKKFFDPKISWQNKKNSIFGRLSKLALVKDILQLHMLLDFKYLFFGKSFGIKIWYTCYQHKDDAVAKFSW